MRVALIKNGVVANMILADLATYQAEIGVTAVDGSGADIGWLWDGAMLKAPPLAPVDLPTAITSARAAVIAFADSITAKVTSRYPVGEVDSWPLQVIEARQVVAGSPLDPNAMLPAMAKNANVTLDVFAANVLAKAALNQNIVVAVQALRVQGETLLNSVTTAEQIPPILTQLKATALAQAHAMGLL